MVKAGGFAGRQILLCACDACYGRSREGRYRRNAAEVVFVSDAKGLKK